MAFILKPGQESFEMVDGPHAGKAFEKGKHYSIIPEQEAGRFMSTAPESRPITKPKEADPVVDTEKSSKKKE